MFTAKKESLFSVEKSKTAPETSGNQFISQGRKATATIINPQGSVKYNTSGNDFVDQFAKVGQYKAQRPYEEIDKDMRLLWSQNPSLTIAFVLYLRMITRIVSFIAGFKTKTVQKGQGLKHEGIMRMIWIAINHEETFWDNLLLFITVGSWKDIFQMLSYDLIYNGWEKRVLSWDKFFDIIQTGLSHSRSHDLIKKYLPQLKSRSQCTTVESQAHNIIAKWLCFNLFPEDNVKAYKKYRKLKTSGTAHSWQQLISQKRFSEIDFSAIHGRALSQLVSGKFLSNQNMEEKYQQWIEKQPVAKYTGYVYELLAPVKFGYRNNLSLKKYQIDTINKQFYQLVETAKNNTNLNTSMIVVLDTSSSMTSAVPGTKSSSYSIGKSLALFFSEMLQGVFKNTFLEFADECEMKRWVGNTPVEKLQNDNSKAYGSTNFQSVADLFVNLRIKGVPEGDFPTGILCISDGCFNNTKDNKTNHKTLLSKLRSYFSEEYVKNFKVVLWDIPNLYYGNKPQTSFEDFADCPNLFHIGGFDGSAVSFILGDNTGKSTPKTSEELFHTAMNQEIMQYIVV